MKKFNVISAFVLFVCATFCATSALATDKSLPLNRLQKILQLQGDEENGVLHFPVSRTDIAEVQGPVGTGVVFTPDFEIEGDLFFQPLGGRQAFLNADIPLKEEEVNRFITALISGGLQVQAYHQHFPSSPQIWFVHFKGTGDAVSLAESVEAAIKQTGTPLPQSQPKNPTTPLNPRELASILHGHATVGGSGVVTVWVYRTNPVKIDGILVNPQANISTNIQFKPTGGDNADVVSDFSMSSLEVNPVIGLMRNKLSWYQGCLYNQEINEHPQLFFDHMIKSGNAYDLAREIRSGLNLTEAEGSHKRDK